MGSNTWVVNKPAVVSEIIDGELVVINFDSGNYYSSLGVGAWIWHCIEQSVPGDIVVATMTSVFGIAQDKALADLDAYIGDLQRENLIRTADATAPSGGVAPALPAGEYHPPRIIAYSNMQDLLLLDPIHDVGEEGWPTRPPERQP